MFLFKSERPSGGSAGGLFTKGLEAANVVSNLVQVCVLLIRVLGILAIKALERVRRSEQSLVVRTHVGVYLEKLPQ